MKEILEFYGIKPVRERYYKCPLHHEKKGASFVLFEDNRWFCFGKCSRGGDELSFISLYEGIPVEAAAQKYYEITGRQHPRRHGRENRHQELYALHEKLQEKFKKRLLYEKSMMAEQAREFLYKKGYALSDIENFGIGLAIEEDFLNEDAALLKQCGLASINGGRLFFFLSDRITYPVYNWNGKIHAFTARSLHTETGTAKYINNQKSPIFEKKKALGGLSSIFFKISRDVPYILFVEGINDALMLQKSGFPALAILGLGNKYLDSVYEVHRRFPQKELIFFFDSDDAGRSQAVRICSQVLLPRSMSWPDARFSFVWGKESMDPDEYVRVYGAEKLRRQIETGRILADDYYIQHAVKRIRGSRDLQERRQQIKAIVAEIEKFPAWMKEEITKEISRRAKTKLSLFASSRHHAAKKAANDVNYFPFLQLVTGNESLLARFDTELENAGMPKISDLLKDCPLPENGLSTPIALEENEEGYWQILRVRLVEEYTRYLEKCKKEIHPDSFTRLRESFLSEANKKTEPVKM